MKIDLSAHGLPPHHVRVDFGAGIPGDVQGPALLAFERYMRERGIPAEVYKATMPDDLRRRRDMTDEERHNL